MTLEQMIDFLLWNLLINMGCLVLVFLLMALFGKPIFRVHAKIFNLEPSTCRTVMYAVLLAYKTMIFMFNLVPLLALMIIKGSLP